MYWDKVSGNLLTACFIWLPVLAVLLAVISTVCWAAAFTKSRRLSGYKQAQAKRRARKLLLWMIIQLALLVVFIIALFLLFGESAEPLPQ